METIGDRADRGGDRPPRLRHAAHAGRAADDRPHHRRLPARPAGPGPRRSSRSACRAIVTQTAAADRRRLGPRASPPRCSCRPRRAQPDPRGQDAPDLLAHPDGRRARHADDGRLAGGPRPRRPDHVAMAAESRSHAGRAAQSSCSRRGRRRPARTSLAVADGRRHLRLQGGRRARRHPSRGEIEGASKHAVAEQLAGAGLKVMDVEREEAASRSDITLASSASRPHELTVMTRQLATMISSGMTLLRALLRARGADRDQDAREALGAVRKDIEAGLLVLRRAAQAPEGLQPALRRDGRAPARRAACSRSRSSASPTSSRRTTTLRRQVKSAMVYPTVVLTFALHRADRR